MIQPTVKSSLHGPFIRLNKHIHPLKTQLTSCFGRDYTCLTGSNTKFTSFTLRKHPYPESEGDPRHIALEHRRNRLHSPSTIANASILTLPRQPQRQIRKAALMVGLSYGSSEALQSQEEPNAFNISSTSAALTNPLPLTSPVRKMHESSSTRASGSKLHAPGYLQPAQLS